ncbi:MAG: multidrug effflux MFS transporter [Hyphomicrobiaceae bacterium]
MTEFTVLIAMMISVVALATDIMLPALDDIGSELAVEHPNDAQLVISSLFLGLAGGQFAVGPLSDSFGRKPIIILGYLLFITGCLISVFATTFSMMLLGRALQGVGMSAPRIVSVAMVRDCFRGRKMARIMSVVMAVFIIVPALAPAMGQAVIMSAGWRATFLLLLGQAVIVLAWFVFRQPETLPRRERRRLSLSSMAAGTKEICAQRSVMGYTIAMGLIFGAFLGYLSSAQQVFQVTFKTGQLFVLYFGVAALAIGVASLVNATIVMSIGMRALTWWAFVAISGFSLVFVVPAIAMNGIPPLWLFMVWLLAVFFCVGIVFGNLNALAMEPLGQMAGLGAAIVGSFATFISLPFGWAIGFAFDGGVVPLVSGFGLLSLASLSLIAWTERPPRRLIRSDS